MKKAAAGIACAAAVATAASPSTAGVSVPHSHSRVAQHPEALSHNCIQNRITQQHQQHRHPWLNVRGGSASNENHKSTSSGPASSSSSSSKRTNKKKHKKKPKQPFEAKAAAEEPTMTASSPSPQTESTTKKTSPHQERIVREILQTEDYYAILGVTKSSTSAEIKKSYRRRAVQTHPDKMADGNRKAFDKVAEAYDVLSDDTKRTIYNQRGKAGLDPAGGGGGGPGNSMEEMFRSFFGAGSGGGGGGRSGPGGPQHHRPRNRTVRYQLEVTLEELYKGMTRTVIVTQPGNPERKRVEVHISQGMASGQSIVLSGEMDAVKNATPADLVFLLAQRPHPIFTRKGHDLAMELEISLKEAICGVERTVRLLDGRMVTICSTKHKVNGQGEEAILIQDGDVQVLKGEGMPKPHGSSSEHNDGVDDGEEQNNDHGDLYLQFKVKMPVPHAAKNSLSSEEREELGRLLDKLQGQESAGINPLFKDRPVCHLERASASDFGRKSGIFRMERDDPDSHLGPDDDHSHHRRQFPFGSKSFSYFSGSPGGNPFPSKGSHFFGDDTGDDYEDDGNVQCQQM